MSESNYSVRLEEYEKYGEPRQKLKVERDGKIILEECDGGEPEDQSFYRDWSWVPEALRTAYEFGREDGRREALEQSGGDST